MSIAAAVVAAVSLTPLVLLVVDIVVLRGRGGPARNAHAAATGSKPRIAPGDGMVYRGPLRADTQ